MTSDLNSFDKLRDDIMQRTKGREDKHVRIVADCAPFLYQNKHLMNVLSWKNGGIKDQLKDLIYVLIVNR